MKITVEHYAEMVNMLNKNIQILCEKNGKTIEELEKVYTDAGMTPKRFRWDMLYAIPHAIRVDWFDRVYKYANDDHIDTALRKFFGHKK